MKFGDVAKRMARLDLHTPTQLVLCKEAEVMAVAVCAVLSQSLDDGLNSLAGRTGTRAAQISVSWVGDSVLIGSDSIMTLNRELGTATAAPRPILAQVAAEHVDRVRQAVATEIADTLRGI